MYCCCGPFVSGDRSSDSAFSLVAHVTLPHETETLLHRDKRQGGGGIIPFRPLFVYRQQQREQQEKWREIEAKKKLKQQSLVQYEQYQDTVNKHQQQLYQSRPPTQHSSYSNPVTSSYSYYNYPSVQYSSYGYPSYYGRYGDDSTYQNLPSSSNYYQDYYDGYEYL